VVVATPSDQNGVAETTPKPFEDGLFFKKKKNRKKKRKRD
jgi:hypothetical protein